MRGSMIRNGCSLAETLVAMGLIGILCVTMLSLNSMSDNKYKIATTKLDQVDSAIKSWGKAISKSNEKGLGALAVISDENDLRKSLTSYFSNQGATVSSEGEKFTDADGNEYTDYTEIKLNNGVILKVKYK